MCRRVAAGINVSSAAGVHTAGQKYERLTSNGVLILQLHEFEVEHHHGRIGDHMQLLEGIQTKLFTLPDPTVVYPGHGPVTTVGHEKRTNPFVGGFAGQSS